AAAPIASATASSLNWFCGSKTKRRSHPASAPAIAYTTTSSATKLYRLGQRCPSVSGPLHRGQVAMESRGIVSRLSWFVHLSTYHSREIPMQSHRVGSTVLLAGGVFLVFGGISSALGFSTSGIVASLAAVAALLYAGGVWFGAAPHADPSILVF